MPVPFIGGTQEANLAIIRNQQQIFDGVLRFLAAVASKLSLFNVHFKLTFYFLE
jgi:hypothetical protein